MGNSSFLFTYGTMLRGERNHSRLVDLGGVFLCEAKTLSQFDLYSRFTEGNYLAPVAVPGENKLVGELFRVPEEAYPVLDLCEGHPRVYKRVSITVISRLLCPAKMYLYVGDRSDLMKDAVYGQKMLWFQETKR